MYQGYNVSGPAIATVLLPIIAPFIGMSKRYMLWIHGATCTSKSTFATMLNSFYGDFDSEVPPQTWDSTPYFIEMFGFYLKDALFLIDNYRHGSVSDGKQKNLIHSYADRVSRGRLSQQSSMKNSYPIRGFAFATGEDLPSGEASTVARLLPVEVSRIGSTEKKDYTQKYVPLFKGITPHFIHYLLNKYDTQTLSLSDEFVKIRGEMWDKVSEVLNVKQLDYNEAVRDEQNEIQDENGVVQNENPAANLLRISINLALNKLGLQFFMDFSSYMGISQEKINELKEGYDGMLNQLIFKYSRVVTEESITKNAIDILSELIASGKLYIDGYSNMLGMEPGRNSTKIGHLSMTREGEFVMITPKILCDEIKKVNKRSVSSDIELYRQLHKIGYIVPEKKTGELTVPTTTRDGVKCRMLKFKKEVLLSSKRFGKPDIDGIERELGKRGKSGYDEDEDLVAPF
jgi:hypothetical protein